MAQPKHVQEKQHDYDTSYERSAAASRYHDETVRHLSAADALARHIDMDLVDLLHQLRQAIAASEGISGEEKHGVLGKIKDTIRGVGDKVRETVERVSHGTKHRAEEARESVREQAGKVGETLRYQAGDLEETLREQAGTVRRKFGETAESVRESVPFDVGDLKATLVDLRQKLVSSTQPTSAAINIPVSLTTVAVGIVYMAFLLRRVWEWRRRTNVRHGDATYERTMLQAKEGDAALAAKSTSLLELTRAVHALRSFSAFAPLSLLSLVTLELSGASEMIVLLASFFITVSIVSYNERVTMRQVRGPGTWNNTCDYTYDDEGSFVGETALVGIPLTIGIVTLWRVAKTSSLGTYLPSW